MHSSQSSFLESLLPLRARIHTLHQTAAESPASTHRSFIAVVIDPAVKTIRGGASAPAGTCCAYAPVSWNFVCHDFLLCCLFYHYILRSTCFLSLQRIIHKHKDENMELIRIPLNASNSMDNDDQSRRVACITLALFLYLWKENCP